MMKVRILLFLLIGQVSLAMADEKQFSFLLASNFDPKKHTLTDYYLSEKLDGVRAYWDGRRLQSRGGIIFTAPQWFLDALPSIPMDGELWISRMAFDEASGIVRRKEACDEWQKIKFMVFDLPAAKGDFSARYQKMRDLYTDQGNAHWSVVEQREPPSSLRELQSMLIKLDRMGGEGFMLKSKSALYHGDRSDDLLKVKLKHDAEAKVIKHHLGKGRLETVMGSMTVEMPSGVRFRIGSGFSDEQRKRPPPIGSNVTYKHNGFTKNGKPRFPVFWRQRLGEY